MLDQKETNWCWAAVTVSVDLFYDQEADPSLCRLVNRVLHRNDCCRETVPKACNTTRRLSDALKARGRYGRLYSKRLSYKWVRGQINREVLVPIAIKWSSGLAHFIVCRGYDYRPAVNRTDLHICDSANGDGTYPYLAVANRYLGYFGRWSHTYVVKTG